MIARISFVLGLLTATFSLAAQAQDAPGASDPAGLKRYEGSRIIHFNARSYDQYHLAVDAGFENMKKIEGGVTRILYLEPEGHTSLEIFRNYEESLSAAGFKQTFELTTGWPCYFYIAFIDGNTPGYSQNPFRIGDCASSGNYAVYEADKGGQHITAALLTAESLGGSWPEPNPKNPTPVKKGQVLAALDYVTAKAVENKMVVVKAADIADALATKGVFDLYGVYFDTDKTDVKPESAPTLDEVANLLKIDRSLRLEVSGHTDNTGGKDHNMKLSQGRAQSVVSVLVTKYGIDVKRLVAKGYGDTKPVAPNDNDADKAKNRRVELRKI